MNTIYELQLRANILRAQLDENSISPEGIGSLISDTLSYLANFEQLSDSLGIRKIYISREAMDRDDAAPVGSNSKPLKYGQLVVINSGTGQPENGNIYAWQKPGWLHIGNVAEVTAMVADIAKLSNDYRTLSTTITSQTETIGSHSTRLQELEVHNVAATQMRDGYMTSQMVFDLETTSLAVNHLCSSTFSGYGDEYSYTLEMNRGQFAPLRFEFPVHGGNDGLHSANTAALLDCEAFNDLTEYRLHITDFRDMMKYIPYEVAKVVDVEALILGTIDEGQLCYNSRDGRFVWESSNPNNPAGRYFLSSARDDRAGLFPQMGRMFFTKKEKRVFIGVSNGAQELTNGTITPPTPPGPPVPPTVTYTTGGGAEESAFVGVIGGGGADESYFDTM